MAYGCREERYPLPIAAVDTHRPKPSKKGRTDSSSTSRDVISPLNEPALQEPTPQLAKTGRDYFGKTAVVGPSGQGKSLLASHAEDEGEHAQTPTAAPRALPLDGEPADIKAAKDHVREQLKAEERA